MFEKGAATSRDVDAAATQLAISKAQLEQAHIRLARANVVAPMTGVLNDVPVEVGEYVTVMPRTTVAEIVDTSVVKVAVEIPERDASFLSVGQKAEVVAEVKGREVSLTGTTTFLSQVADPRTRCTRMEITVPNREGLLRSGQIVHARLTRQILKDAILVPLAAVIPMEDGKAVYVVESVESAAPNRHARDHPGRPRADPQRPEVRGPTDRRRPSLRRPGPEGRDRAGGQGEP